MNKRNLYITMLSLSGLLMFTSCDPENGANDQEYKPGSMHVR